MEPNTMNIVPGEDISPPLPARKSSFNDFVPKHAMALDQALPGSRAPANDAASSSSPLVPRQSRSLPVSESPQGLPGLPNFFNRTILVPPNILKKLSEGTTHHAIAGTALLTTSIDDLKPAAEKCPIVLLEPHKAESAHWLRGIIPKLPLKRWHHVHVWDWRVLDLVQTHRSGESTLETQLEFQWKRKARQTFVARIERGAGKAVVRWADGGSIGVKC
jgi:hypothetical protein